MKKIALLLALILSLSFATGCSNEKTNDTFTTKPTTTTEQVITTKTTTTTTTTTTKKTTTKKTTTKKTTTKKTTTTTEAEEENNSYTVYITDTGSKYHRSGCGSLWSSSHAISIDDAISQGYEPCGRCNP